jgi:hypothetical protein
MKKFIGGAKVNQKKNSDKIWEEKLEVVIEECDGNCEECEDDSCSENVF